MIFFFILVLNFVKKLFAPQIYFWVIILKKQFNPMQFSASGLIVVFSILKIMNSLAKLENEEIIIQRFPFLFYIFIEKNRK